DGDVDLFLEQRVFELFDKDALSTEFSKRSRLQLVAGSLEDHDFGFDAGELEQLFANKVRLPPGKQAASRADAQVFHVRSRLDRNRSRRASTFWTLRRISRSPRRRSAGSTRSFSSNSSIKISMR